MSDNKNLHISKKEKNDEFYTLYEDVEKEVKEYKDQLKDKIIYCNCDNPEFSNFWKYLSDNFEYYKLKKLISSHYIKDGNSYKLEISRDNDGILNTQKTTLKGNGDFRSDECIEILKECDIVITNVPFSLFREYINQLMKYDKKFLVIGHQNAITYKEVFRYIKDNKLWLGVNPRINNFIKPNGEIQKFGNICWFTNLNIKKRNKDLVLNKKYTPEEYPKYDNYDAINVDKVKDIPVDYFGCMGVPITYLSYHNPEQFEIIKFRKGNDDKDLSIKGKNPYCRILIKNISNDNQFEILGMTSSAGYNKEIVGIPFLGDKDARPIIKGKNTYARVFIKNNSNDNQFEIIGNEYDLNIEKGRGYINGKRMYSRIFIKRK